MVSRSDRSSGSSTDGTPAENRFIMPPSAEANSSLLVVRGTLTVYTSGNTEAMVSERYWLMFPSSSVCIFIFTTMTPSSVRWSRTMVKNSTEDIWKGIVIS